jgi:hypothetical protein
MYKSNAYRNKLLPWDLCSKILYKLLLGASNCLHGMPRSTRVMGLFWSDWREAAVLFVTYLWGKPQLRRRRRMRRGQNSPMDKSLKRPGREARNERKVPWPAEM